MRKVVFFSNSLWNLYNFRLDLIAKFIEDGYKVYLLAPTDHSLKLFNHLDCEIFDIPIKRKGLNPLLEIKLLSDIFFILQKIKPHLLFTFTIKPNIYGSIASRLQKIPVINNITGLGYTFIKGGVLKRIVIFLYKIALSNSKIIFFQNSFDKEIFIKNSICSKKVAQLIPGSGINTAEFPVRNSTSQNFSHPIKFLFIGRLLKDKGIFELISAATNLKNLGYKIKILVVGDLDLGNPASLTKEQLEKCIEDKIFDYLGYLDDVRDVIKECHCVILPSYREGLSRALLEGASMGKPLLGSDVPGCKEVISNNNGITFKPKSSLALKEAIVNFYNLDNQSKNQMGINSRELIIKNFDVQIVIDKYLNAAEKFCKNT